MAFGDPNPGYTLPVVTPGAGFNAMMTRFYDEFGNVQGRNEKAFGYYEDEKAREADAYQRMLREQELARQRQRMLDNERRQKEAQTKQLEDQERRRVAGERHKAEMNERGYANASALRTQLSSGPSPYKQIDPRVASAVDAYEGPARLKAMAGGGGSSQYDGRFDAPGAGGSGGQNSETQRMLKALLEAIGAGR